MMVNPAVASYEVYKYEEQELTRQLEYRRRQRERLGEEPAQPGHGRRALRRVLGALRQITSRPASAPTFVPEAAFAPASAPTPASEPTSAPAPKSVPASAAAPTRLPVCVE